MMAVDVRLLRVMLLACVLALGVTLVRGITGMFEAAVYGIRPPEMAAVPSK